MESQHPRPLVTVLMSVFNGEQWLSQSIESILAQSFVDFEFVIVNDGSHDGSLDIMTRYAAVDSRIRVIDKSNSGLADALNTGIAASMGEWIARIDADDMSEPSRLAMQLDFVRTNKTCVLVGTARSELDEHGNIDGIERFPCHHSPLCRMMLALLNPIAHSSAFIQAKALRSVGGYRTRIKRSQDYDLWLRLSELGTVACIDKPLVRIRHHANQVSHESSGLRSIVDSTVALASFLLKRRGHADPVSLQSSDEEFQQFWQFIHQGVLQDKTWEFRQFMGQLKASLQNPNTIEKCSGIFFALRNPPLLVRLVHTRTFGERLAEKLVEDWINRGKKLCAD